MAEPAAPESAAQRPAPGGPVWLAKIHVTLKPVVNDPSGLAVMGGLRQLGYGGVESVRLGKYLEVRLVAPDQAAAEAQVDQMCRRLLANPVIEDYRYAVEATADAQRD
jgi:phosphoribosylformylglycinamidine synthase